MSHFLSDATHDRLFHRQEPINQSQSRAASAAQQQREQQQQQDANTVSSVTGLPAFRAPSSAPSGAITVDITGPGAGLFKSTNFEGPIRCAGVAQTVKHGHAPVVWSGDTEGTLSLRDAATGEVRILLEQREKNVYAYTIVFVPNEEAGGDIWVGFSDGYLCVLDADTGAKKFETRAHGGAIYAMEYHAITNRVYICGADWQITAWNAEKMCRAPAPSQMSGHQNGVRSLCFGVGGNSMILYSGADDYTIRAWDVTKHQELTNRWPAVGHKGGVHNLACTGQLLFSGSTDGTVRVWSAAFGEPIRVVDNRHVPINSLCFDEANNCVWAGGIDGVINIWDATDLSLRADLTEHHATHVTMIKPVARLAACKVWSLTKDGIQVHYVDTDGAVGGGDAIENTRQAEIECINDVDRRRKKVIECDIILNDLRRDGELMQEREKTLKEYTVDALHHAHNRSIQQQYLNQVWQFVNKRRRLRIATAEANMLATRNNNHLARRYWSKWASSLDELKTKRMEDAAAAAVEGMEAGRLRAHYAHTVLEAARRRVTQVTQSNTAAALLSLTDRAAAIKAFRVWSEAAGKNKQTRREKRGREQLALATSGHYERATASWAWYKLAQQAYALQTRKNAKAHAIALGAVREQDLRRRYYDMWLSFNHNSRREYTNMKLSNLLKGVDNELDQLREKAAKSAKNEIGKLNSTMAAHAAHMKELAELRANIAAVQDVSEADLNNAIAAKEREVALIQAETRKEQMVLEELRKEQRELQRELMRDASLDTSKPVLDQLNQAMYLLKARGVNVQKDNAVISAAREAAAKKTPAGAAYKVYVQGLTQIKEVFQDVIKPHPLTEYDAPIHWMVRGALEKFYEKHMNKAISGLVTMITAFDTMGVGSNGQAWIMPDPKAKLPAGQVASDVFKPEFAHHEEVILNFGPLLDLAIRIFKWRRGEISLTEPPPPAEASPSPARAPAGKRGTKSASASPRSATASPAGKKPAAKPARATSATPSKAPQRASSSTKAPAAKPAAKKAVAAAPSKSPAKKSESTKAAAKAPAAKPAARKASPKPAAKRTASAPKPAEQ